MKLEHSIPEDQIKCPDQSFMLTPKSDMKHLEKAEEGIGQNDGNITIETRDRIL